MHASIALVELSDLSLVRQIVSVEFSYFDESKYPFEKRISDPRFFLWKISVEQQFAGFVEFEALPESDSLVRLNGIGILPAFRSNGLAFVLLDFSLGELSKKGFETAILLVAKDNSVAKKLYAKAGFSFEAYDLPIDGKAVERWKRELKPKSFAGVC